LYCTCSVFVVVKATRRPKRSLRTTLIARLMPSPGHLRPQSRVGGADVASIPHNLTGEHDGFITHF
jgi:hypothetical protein